MLYPLNHLLSNSNHLKSEESKIQRETSCLEPPLEWWPSGKQLWLQLQHYLHVGLYYPCPNREWDCLPAPRCAFVLRSLRWHASSWADSWIWDRMAPINFEERHKAKPTSIKTLNYSSIFAGDTWIKMNSEKRITIEKLFRFMKIA